MSDTNEAAKPQKWTERNAAALALVDRLPMEVQSCAFINALNTISIWESAHSKAVRDFVKQFAPDAEIKIDATLARYGTQNCSVEFADGAILRWDRRVTITITTDEE